jgi:hypothetical protein
MSNPISRPASTEVLDRSAMSRRRSPYQLHVPIGRYRRRVPRVTRSILSQAKNPLSQIMKTSAVNNNEVAGSIGSRCHARAVPSIHQDALCHGSSSQLKTFVQLPFLRAQPVSTITEWSRHHCEAEPASLRSRAGRGHFQM